MKALVIAEKPSVAMALASVLGARTRKDGYVEGNGYIVSWCVGHLVGLCDASEYDEKYKKWRYEDLPIVPECWKHKILEGTKKQFGILKKLMRDSEVNEVICATDAGREGELIFRLVYEQAGCKKPMKRLWISSMEEQAIKDGFASLKDGSCYDSLYQSALCRAKADWLVGINASRLFSVLYNQNLKVGRVQTPTLAMLTERQDRIEHFQKETFYRVELTDGKLVAVSENITNKADAELLVALCDGSEAIITELKREQKKVSPPKLYDLTSLQREANRYFGFTAKKTLDLLQELYEEKLVTYPRTDSRFVTEDMIGTVEELAGKMPLMLPFVEYGQLGHNIKRVVNNEKVSDHQYVIQGIGKHEMTILVIQFLAAIGLLLICAIFGNITIGLFIGAAIVIITFFLLIRDNANENLIDKVRIMMNYSKMQKKYYYEYFNVYDPKKENTMETKE